MIMDGESILHKRVKVTSIEKSNHNFFCTTDVTDELFASIVKHKIGKIFDALMIEIKIIVQGSI